MGKVSVKAPDGSTLSFNAPEGATDDQIMAYAKSNYKPDEPSALGDVATSFGRGVAKGTIGLAGLPGDIASGLNKGIDYLTGQEPPKDNSYALATSEELTKPVEKVFGKFQEPKTTAGRYGQSVGEFLPSSVIGPGGKLIKAATTLGGGLGAEAGGELGESLDHPGAGRFLGGLVGGAGTGIAGAERQASRLSKQLPTDQAIKADSQAGYEAISNARLQVRPAAMDNLVNGARTDLDRALHVEVGEGGAPRTFKGLKQLEANRSNSTNQIAHILDVHQALGDVPPWTADGQAASIVRGSIERWIDNLHPSQVIKGDPAFTTQQWQRARSGWRAHKKLEAVERAQQVGENRASVSGSGSNTENAMRQNIRGILDNPKKVRGFSPETRAKMQQIVSGTKLRNAARYAGKYAPSGPVSAAGTVMADLQGGLGAATVFAAVTELARRSGVYLTQREIRELGDMIKAESPLGAPVAARIAPQIPNRQAIIPSAAARSAMDVLSNPGQDGLE